jgi:hypothetical protein
MGKEKEKTPSLSENVEEEAHGLERHTFPKLSVLLVVGQKLKTYC